MILTKHCEPEVREYMLSGSFRIGSHVGYSKAESNGALNDDSEGLGATRVPGSTGRISGRFAYGTFANCDFGGPGEIAMHFEERVNSCVFCASSGTYSFRRHALILEGVPEAGYLPNDKYTAFLSLDAGKLLSALNMATDELFGVRTTWIADEVHYEDRIRLLDPGQLINYSAEEMNKRIAHQAFTKPTRFECEEEYRFVMLRNVGARIPEAFLTSSLSKQVQQAFVEAIVDEGSTFPVKIRD